MKLHLHEQENLRNVYRQSGLFLAKPLILAAIIAVVPTFFFIQYGLFSSFRWIISLLAFIGLAIFLREFIIWRKNKYIITNKRLLLHSHDGLFKRSVIETPLERILNVSYKTTGAFSVLFGYGDVEVQVVGLIEPMVLRHINQPDEIKDYIWELHKRVVPSSVGYNAEDIPHYQEKVGYTKKNQRLL